MDPGYRQSRRDFPRLKEALEVHFEFVKWNESEVVAGPRAQRGWTTDLSASGIGLETVPELTAGLIKQLLSGQKKARLALTLGNGVTLHLFGRLAWSGLQNPGSALKERAGFRFLDVDSTSFRLLRDYVDIRLPEES